jgi:hypothetical protein
MSEAGSREWPGFLHFEIGTILMNKIFAIASVCASALALNARAFDTCETVMVGGVRVNRSDYDADQEKPAKERQYGKLDTKQEDAPQSSGDAPMAPPAPAPEPQPVAPAPEPQPVAPAPEPQPVAPSPGGLLISKEGNRYFVVNAQGEKVTDNAAIDAKKGYASEPDAWAAAIAGTPH